MKHVVKYALELHAPTVVREQTVTQNDTIEFVISLSQGGEPIDMSGVTPSLAVKRRDGVTTALPGTVSDNTVTFALGSTETAKPGTVYAAVQLYGADGRVSSLPFTFQVKADLTAAGTIPSEKEATLIEVVLQDGPGIIQRAETAAADAERVAVENKTNWLDAVATVAERDTAYPSPKHGDTVRVTGTATVYRYEDGKGWVVTDKYQQSAVDALNQQLADTAGEIKTRTSGLQPRPIQDVSETLMTATDVIPITTFNGFLWGRIGSNLYRSGDAGGTWEPWGTSPEPLINIMPTVDAEVVATSGKGLYKSSGFATGSPTWTKKATSNGTTQFHGWSLAGNGQKFMTTEYAAGSGFPDSRYARMSKDAGETWEIAYDSVLVHGETLANASHLHGVAYDQWSDRWYLSEGHGSIAGIYVSEDDGVTWKRAKGMAIMDPSPTVIIPTDDGLVCASDHPKGGLYGVIRRDDPMEEELVRTVAWQPGTVGTSGFGIQGVRDEETGIVYIGYRTEKAEAAPVLLAGTPTSGGIAYTWGGDFIAYDDIRNVVIPKSGTINFIVSTQGHTVSTFVQARLVVPGTHHVSLSDTGNALGGVADMPNSIAIGPRASTGGVIRSVVIGVGATTQGTQDNTAIGYGAKTEGSSATAIGANTSAQHANSTVIGDRASSLNSNAIAIGARSSANSSGIAVGYNVVAPTSSVVIGANANVLAGSAATIVGYSGQARNNGTSIGYQTFHNGNNGTTIGHGTTVGADSTAIGQGATAPQVNSVAIGKGTNTTALDQVAFGARHLMALAVPSDAPAAPEGGGVLFFKDNGAGKIGLYARFATGSVVGPIALQP